MAKTKQTGTAKVQGAENPTGIFKQSLQDSWPANYAAFNKRLKALLVELGEDEACAGSLWELTEGEVKFD